MRALKWALIAAGALVLCAAAFLFRHDRYDPLHALKPFITADETQYEQFETGPPFPKKTSFMQARFVQLSHADWNRTLEVIKQQAAREKVWRPMRNSNQSMQMDTPAGSQLVEMDNAMWHTSKGLEGDAIEATHYPNLKVDPGRITIQVTHIMSSWEVWWLRVKNIGKKDPFQIQKD